jgi:hypothetical protein
LISIQIGFEHYLIFFFQWLFQASSTDFGALHTGILAIANVVCGSQAWMNNIIPATELERENVARIVPGRENPVEFF